MTDATQQVLVVEDEEKLAQVLKEYLQQAGYEAHCLYHGDEVMPWLENSLERMPIFADLGITREGLHKKLSKYGM